VIRTWVYGLSTVWVRLFPYLRTVISVLELRLFPYLSTVLSVLEYGYFLPYLSTVRVRPFSHLKLRIAKPTTKSERGAWGAGNRDLG
jgi:hypothetical protein